MFAYMLIAATSTFVADPTRTISATRTPSGATRNATNLPCGNLGTCTGSRVGLAGGFGPAPGISKMCCPVATHRFPRMSQLSELQWAPSGVLMTSPPCDCGIRYTALPLQPATTADRAGAIDAATVLNGTPPVALGIGTDTCCVWLVRMTTAGPVGPTGTW